MKVASRAEKTKTPTCAETEESDKYNRHITSWNIVVRRKVEDGQSWKSSKQSVSQMCQAKHAQALRRTYLVQRWVKTSKTKGLGLA